MGLLYAGTAAASVRTVSELEALEAALNDPEVTEVRLTAAVLDEEADFSRYLELDLGSEEKTLFAEAFSLPLLRVERGTLTIHDGRLDAATAAMMMRYEAAVDPGELRQPRSRHLVQVKHGATVVFDGTHIAVPADDDPHPAVPGAVVELRSETVEDGSGVRDTRAGSVFFLNVRSGGLPITRALALTVGEAPGNHHVEVDRSELVFGRGGVVHAVHCGAPCRFAYDDSALVEVENSILRGGSGSGALDVPSAVGMAVSVGSDSTASLPFLHSAGRLNVRSSRLSNLTTTNDTLMVAPVTQLDGALIDGIAVRGELDESAALVHAQNAFISSSLVCGVTGPRTLFVSAMDWSNSLAHPHSVHVLSSVLWQLDGPLFTLELPSADRPDHGAYRGLVAANVTLHRARGASDVVSPNQHSETAMPGVFENVYLQGQWTLGDAFVQHDDEPSRMGLAARAVVAARVSDDAVPCGDAVGCSEIDEHYLVQTGAVSSCGAVMDRLEAALLVDGVAGLAGSLASLDPDDFHASAELPILVEPLEVGTSWQYPSDDMLVAKFHACGADTPVAFEVGGFADHADPCSLGLLQPVRATAGEAEMELGDTGLFDADSGLGPDPPSALRTGETHYGFGVGCRSVGGVACLVLPLGLGRRGRRFEIGRVDRNEKARRYCTNAVASRLRQRNGAC